MVVWFLQRDGAEHGPFSHVQLRELASGGKLQPDDLLRPQGSTAAQPAREIAGLFSPPPPARANPAGAKDTRRPPPPPSRIVPAPPPPSPTSSPSRIVPTLPPVPPARAASVQRATTPTQAAATAMAAAQTPGRRGVAAVFVTLLLIGSAAGAFYYAYHWDRERRVSSALASAEALWGAGDKEKAVVEYRKILHILPEDQRDWIQERIAEVESRRSGGGPAPPAPDNAGGQKAPGQADNKSGSSPAADASNSGNGGGTSPTAPPPGSIPLFTSAAVGLRPGQNAELEEVDAGGEIFDLGGAFLCALSPDGKRATLVRVDEKNVELRLVHTLSGKSIHAYSFGEPPLPQRSKEDGSIPVALSADGRYFLWTSDNGVAAKAHIFDVDAGVERTSIDLDRPRHKASGLRPARAWLSGDGRSILYCGPSGIERISSGGADQIIAHSMPTVTCFAVSRDGSRALSGLEPSIARGQERAIILLSDTRTGRELQRFERLPRVTCLALSTDGNYALSGGGYHDATVRIWDLATGKTTGKFEGHALAENRNQIQVQALAFLPDVNAAISASAGRIYYWDLRRQAVLGTLRGGAYSLSMSADSTLSLTCPSTRLWRLPRFREAQSAPNDSVPQVGPNEVVQAGQPKLTVENVVGDYFGFPSREPILLARTTGSQAQADVAFYNAMTGRRLAPLILDSDLQSFASPAGMPSVSGFGNWRHEDLSALMEFRNVARSYPAAAHKIREIVDGGRRTAQMHFLSPDAKIVARGGSGARLAFLEASTGDELVKLRDAGVDDFYANLSQLLFAPDGNKVAIVQGSKMKLWDLATGSEISSLSNEPGSYLLAFSPDGRSFAAFVNRSTLKIWDTSGGIERPAPVPSSGSFRSGRFSPSSELLVAGESSAKGSAVIVWSIKTEQTIKRFPSHEVQSASFAGNDDVLITWEKEKQPYFNRVLYREVATGRELARVCFEGQAVEVVRVSVSFDGRYVAAVDVKGLLRLWEMATDTLVPVK